MKPLYPDPLAIPHDPSAVPYKDRHVPCQHPGHKPPMFISIPAGETYVHVCPGCGERRYIHGSDISFGSRIADIEGKLGAVNDNLYDLKKQIEKLTELLRNERQEDESGETFDVIRRTNNK